MDNHPRISPSNISANDHGPAILDTFEEVSYTDAQIIGKGSFGTVFKATLTENGETVAIKKISLDKPLQTRELQILQKLEHQNINKLKQYYHSTEEQHKDKIFLNLVLEYLPSTLSSVITHHRKSKTTVPLLYTKVFTYQLFRSLAYLHARGICHRDIKPQNLLVDPESGLLKLCDFGSAKELVPGQASLCYVCSRYYRAPELIFEARDYTCQVDTWSGGCVAAELLLGQPLFPGASSVDQIVAIIKVLGTPARDQIHAMNPHYAHTALPVITAHPWDKVFRPRTDPEAVSLVSRLLQYVPADRLTPLRACFDAFFAELQSPLTKLPGGKELPPLFNFSQHELSVVPHLKSLNTSAPTPDTAGTSQSNTTDPGTF